MSGPVQPPLTVTTVGGTPSGRPITTIKVSDGDLTISGNVATIDTSGSGGIPGGSDTQIQFNNSGAFGGDAGFTMAVEGGGDTTAVQIGKMKIGASGLIQNNTLNGLVFIYSEGAGQIYLTGSTDGGGTFTDQTVNIMCNADTDTATLKLRNASGVQKEATIDLDGNTDVNIKNLTNGKDIILTTGTTGVTRLKNSTTDTATQLNIQGNGTGEPIINLSNDTKAVTIKCDESQKLKVAGGSSNFIFDASSATGGITWPDGTTQITAASGSSDNNFDVLIPATLPVQFNTRFIISQLPPWGSGDTTSTTNASQGNRPMCYPFIAPKSGDVDEIGIYITSSAASGNIYIALYDSDTNGYADSLLGYATMSVTSTGRIYQTSLSATPTLVRGKQYWYSFNVDSAVAPYLMSASPEGASCVGTGNNVEQNSMCFYDATVSTYSVPPASFTNSYSFAGVDRPVCSLKIS
tara:strand:- start:723 stop:2114 length:1392 start_codon:yes stop_codon:yes gene_type:complete